jgi:WS/DGAT/MGAT family acyltransferase
MAQRLDHERPLWRLDLLPAEDGGVAVVARIHHCMADGITAIRVLASILWDPIESGAQQQRERPGIRPARHQGRLRTAAQLPGTLRRELRPGADSPLDRHIGSAREVAWTGVSLAELKRIGHAAGDGVTVNDVVLATVAGALRSWLDDGDAPKSLRAQVPVSLHSREESGEAGNRDSFLFVDLPLGEEDPAERLRRINAETHERKLDHDAETLYSFFHSLSHFKPLYREVTRLASGPREFALSVSNVPGPRAPVTVMGRPIGRFASFAEPADRHALRVAVVSLGGEVAFGLCSDPDAVGGLDRLADGLDQSLYELKELV